MLGLFNVCIFLQSVGNAQFPENMHIYYQHQSSKQDWGLKNCSGLIKKAAVNLVSADYSVNANKFKKYLQKQADGLLENVCKKIQILLNFLWKSCKKQLKLKVIVNEIEKDR